MSITPVLPPGSKDASSAESAVLFTPGHPKGGHTLHPLAPVDAVTNTAPAVKTALNIFEKAELSSAKRLGFLVPGNSSTDTVRRQFYHECQLHKRPYVVVERDGTSIFVDASTVAGKGKSRSFEGVTAVLGRMQALFGALEGSKDGRGLAVSNTDTLLDQSRRLAIGVLEGSNAFKKADKLGGPLAPTFYLFTTGKSQARALAGRIAATAENPPNPDAIDAARAQRTAAKRTRRFTMLDRKLGRLVDDPIAVKNLRVRAGVLDGFLRSGRSPEARAANIAAQAQRAAHAASKRIAGGARVAAVLAGQVARSNAKIAAAAAGSPADTTSSGSGQSA